jgi:hypothetical protein
LENGFRIVDKSFMANDKENREDSANGAISLAGGMAMIG